MLTEHIQRLMQSVPGLPQSLRQSFDNPLQADRLPQTGTLETEFPVNSESKSDVRKIIFKTLIVAVFLSLLRSIPEYFIPINWAYDVWGLYASAAAVTIVVSLVGMPSKFWHWPLYLFGLPTLVLYILYLRSLFALLLLAAIFTAIVADQFTKQTLYLGTTTPFPRDRARTVRKKWTTRFFSLNTIRGMEFYLLLIGLLAATPWLFDGIATAINPKGGSYRLIATFTTLGIVVLAPIVIELLAAVIYNRRPLKITTASKAFNRAFAAWFCYNNKNVLAPGILQSPVANSKTRRKILIATILLWTAAFNPILSYKHHMHEQLSVARARTIQEKAAEKAAGDKATAEMMQDLYSGKTAMKEQQTFRNKLQEDATLRLWDGDLKHAPPQAKGLQPYQQKLLVQMSPEQRIEYLKQVSNYIEPFDSSADSLAKNSVSEDTVSEQPKERFFLFSQIEHPYRNDIVSGKYGRERFGFLFSALFMFFAARELVLLFIAFSFPLAFLYAASVRVASSLREQLEAHPDTILSFGNWNRLVDEVTSPAEKTEKASLLLGTNKSDGSPVVVPQEVFEEHAHILGDSGSGKTSMGIALILNQLVRQKDCSIVVLDLKGDDTALFNGTKIDAEQAGKPFRWFTNELGRSTYGFNPLTQEYFQELSLYQKTDVITAALGLQYGTDYGRGYYSDANADYLYRTFQSRPNIRSFERLARILPSGAGVNVSPETRKVATHLVSVVQRLSATEALNLTEDSAYPPEVLQQQIDFADVFRKPQVVYMHLPSSLGGTSAAEIARIALYSLLGSARQTADAERKQVFVFIDEFQRIVANNLDLILQTARSMGIGLILANQSIFDLKKQGVDLMPTVRTNTRYKQVFAASNVEDLRELVELSGEALVHTRSFSQDMGLAGSFVGGIFRMQQSESTSPRLRVNDVLLATDAPDQSIVQIRRGAGFAQYGGFPFVMRSQFHISKQEYTERKKIPWPENNTGTLIGSEVAPSSLMDEFEDVDPLETTENQLNASSSGTDALDDLLTGSDAQLSRRQRRRNSPKQEPPTS